LVLSTNEDKTSLERRGRLGWARRALSELGEMAPPTLAFLSPLDIVRIAGGPSTAVCMRPQFRRIHRGFRASAEMQETPGDGLPKPPQEFIVPLESSPATALKPLQQLGRRPALHLMAAAALAWVLAAPSRAIAESLSSRMRSRSADALSKPFLPAGCPKISSL